jgi:hypothetical protein
MRMLFLPCGSLASDRLVHSGYADNDRRMDQYGSIWKDTNAIPEIGHVDLALTMELVWFDGVPTSTLPS